MVNNQCTWKKNQTETYTRHVPKQCTKLLTTHVIAEGWFNNRLYLSNPANKDA